MMMENLLVTRDNLGAVRSAIVHNDMRSAVEQGEGGDGKMKRSAARQRMQTVLRRTRHWVRHHQADAELTQARAEVKALANSLSGISLGTSARGIYRPQAVSYQTPKGTPDGEIDAGMAAKVDAAVERLRAADRDLRKRMESLSTNPCPTGELLKSRRLAAGLTQEDLAERLGIEQSALSMMETGARPISKRTALAVEAVLNARHTRG
jgi:DNA-binding XRE family transcriptional regulator